MGVIDHGVEATDGALQRISAADGSPDGLAEDAAGTGLEFHQMARIVTSHLSSGTLLRASAITGKKHCSLKDT